VALSILFFVLNLGAFLASIGGQDDNNLVIWDVETGMAICGSPASHDSTLVVTWHNTNPFQLVTGGGLIYI